MWTFQVHLFSLLHAQLSPVKATGILVLQIKLKSDNNCGSLSRIDATCLKPYNHPWLFPCERACLVLLLFLFRLWVQLSRFFVHYRRSLVVRLNHCFIVPSLMRLTWRIHAQRLTPQCKNRMCLAFYLHNLKLRTELRLVCYVSKKSVLGRMLSNDNLSSNWTPFEENIKFRPLLNRWASMFLRCEKWQVINIVVHITFYLNHLIGLQSLDRNT